MSYGGKQEVYPSFLVTAIIFEAPEKVRLSTYDMVVAVSLMSRLIVAEEQKSGRMVNNLYTCLLLYTNFNLSPYFKPL